MKKAAKKVRYRIFSIHTNDGLNFSGFAQNKTEFLNDFVNRGICNLNLKNLDLRRVKFRTVLRDCNFAGAKLPDFQIPQNKKITVYKKAYLYGAHYLVTLTIPKEAKRTACIMDGSKKCRAEFAIVSKIEKIDCGSYVSTSTTLCFSSHDPNFMYRLGFTVHPRSYSGDIGIECAPGIHFYMNKRNAINHG